MAGIRKSRDTVYLLGILALVVIFFALLVWMTRRDLLLTIIFFVALLATIALITFYLIKRERRYVQQSGIDEVEKMSGRHFAYYVKELFKRQGFTVKETVIVGNYGADLILERAGEKVVVQARRWKNNVGSKGVQELVDSAKQHNAHNRIVITNTYFSDKAIELAQSSGIELWDRNRLVEIIREIRKNH